MVNSVESLSSMLWIGKKQDCCDFGCSEYFFTFFDRIATEDRFSSAPVQVHEVGEKKNVVNDKLEQEDGKHVLNILHFSRIIVICIVLYCNF